MASDDQRNQRDAIVGRMQGNRGPIGARKGLTSFCHIGKRKKEADDEADAKRRTHTFTEMTEEKGQPNQDNLAPETQLQ